MNRCTMLAGAWLVVLGTTALAGNAAEPEPVLQTAAAGLRIALAELQPAPTFEYPSPSVLVVKYRTRKFWVHSASMIGRFSEKAREIEGPSYMGFILTLRIQEAGTVNQAVVPQTLKEPYWRTDLNVNQARGTGKQVFSALSYGSRTKAATLQTVKAAVAALGPTDGLKGGKGTGLKVGPGKGVDFRSRT